MSKRRNWKLPKRFEPQFPSRDVIGDRQSPYPGLSTLKKHASSRKVFLNIPYDEEYLQTLLPAVVTACWAFRLQPFRLSEDVTGPRLQRLFDHILQSEFVITDLSRSRRMNMPFEVGLAYGCGRSCAILVDNQLTRERDISDLKGLDLLQHREDRDELIRLLCNWFKARFRQRKWSTTSLIIDPKKLTRVVEPKVRTFIEDHLKKHASLYDLRAALVGFWQKADVEYMEEYAEIHEYPFNKNVETNRINLMKKFFTPVN